ncbi:dynein intermediate chain [Lentinula edodes]|uniref:Dynein intermediate chain n=1 Tax=Lentinula edodes TaxID=5353 RepID=A0A1Q3EF42_LENED|nr:dynein intermediate chain [Lentinula edodes]
MSSTAERRQQIEAKRAKLAELRKARADRQISDSNRRSAETSAGSFTPRNNDVDDLLSSILRESRGPGARNGEFDSGELTPSSSMPGTPLMGTSLLPSSLSGRASRNSDFASSIGTTLAPSTNSATDNVIDREMVPRFLPDLIDVEQELFELPTKKERVIYNKEVQTMEVETETPDLETETLQRGVSEIDLEALQAARDRELEEESVQLDKEIEEEIREIPPEELASILAAPELLEFVDSTTKMFYRAIHDYDPTRDYRVGTETGSDESEGRVKRVCEFFDEQYTKNRSITDVDWSPQYPELSVASYNKNAAALNEPDGIVAVWNLHLLERPEFVFHSQSDVLSVTFSPFHSNLVFGGTYSGQILLWDNRSKHLPVLKTPLSASGHTHPVYSMQMVGTQNAHNLITSSTDGTVCSCIDSFWVGTEEGNVYQANRYDRAGAKAGLNQYDVYKAHAGPVMGLHFHPTSGSVDFSDLFLTSSVDWTVKLWRSKSLAKPSTTLHAISPLYSFDESDDPVYDVKWHPTHPAVFGAVDGSGKFDLWNLNMDTEVPVVQTTVGSGRALNKLQWDKKDGRRAALGGSDGRLYIYDIGDMALPRELEWTDLQKTVSGMVGGAQTNGLVDGDVRSMAGR